MSSSVSQAETGAFWDDDPAWMVYERATDLARSALDDDGSDSDQRE